MSSLKTIIITAFVAGFATLGYGVSSNELIADLRQDVEFLRREMGRYQLELEALGRENRELLTRLSDMEALHGQAGIEKAEVEKKIAHVAEVDAAARKKILEVVEEQFDKFVEKTQKVMNTFATTVAEKTEPKKKAPKPFVFTTDYPKEGIEYVVKPGDSISVIATKLNSSTRDIQNANRIADPRILQVGQVIFVPQRTTAHDQEEDYS